MVCMADLICMIWTMCRRFQIDHAAISMPAKIIVSGTIRSSATLPLVTVTVAKLAELTVCDEIPTPVMPGVAVMQSLKV